MLASMFNVPVVTQPKEIHIVDFIKSFSQDNYFKQALCHQISLLQKQLKPQSPNYNKFIETFDPQYFSPSFQFTDCLGSMTITPLLLLMICITRPCKKYLTFLFSMVLGQASVISNYEAERILLKKTCLGVFLSYSLLV